MLSLNMTHRNESYVGRAFPLNSTQTGFFGGYLQPTSLASFTGLDGLDGLGSSTNTSGMMQNLDMVCRGYGGGDVANVGVQCSLLLGPPERTDGGDPRLLGDNSTWRQSLHACASVTRARLQNVHFSLNGTSSLSNLRITRENTNTPVLWAVENTTLNITNIDLFWGQVADSYENDSSLTTYRNEVFYTPAGASDVWGVPATGQPSTIPSVAWNKVYSSLGIDISGFDYSGRSNFALLDKWQGLYTTDPLNGPARMNNLVWTDMVANTLVGIDTAGVISVAAYEASLSYDVRYSIPALISLAMWLPIFLSAVVILLTGALRFPHMRHLLNQTSVGRIVVGDSVLDPSNSPRMQMGSGGGETTHLGTTRWAEATGQTLVVFDPPGNGGSVEQQELSSVDGQVGEGNGRENGKTHPRRTTLRKVLTDFISWVHSGVAAPPHSELPSSRANTSPQSAKAVSDDGVDTHLET